MAAGTVVALQATGLWEQAELLFTKLTGASFPDNVGLGLFLLTYTCSVNWTHAMFRTHHQSLPHWIVLILSFFLGSFVMIALAVVIGVFLYIAIDLATGLR